MSYTEHYSVLLYEVLESFQDSSLKVTNPVFADLTFGGGGHSFNIVNKFPDAKLYSVDQDDDALENGHKKIKSYKLESRLFLNKMNFESFYDFIIENHPETKFNGIVMDLGVSSHHFEDFSRGFSFREDATLDMRMNTSGNAKMAKDILNELSESELQSIIEEYGEEKYSKKIARAIVEKRSESPLETTKELESICFHAYPKQLRHKKIHPATKTFQAIRIYINRELEVLENTIPKMYDLLAVGGKLCIISFHSLEDRIVKHKFKEIFQNKENLAKIITKRPITPSEKELNENPKSRSAKLRVIEKSTTEGVQSGKKYQKFSKIDKYKKLI